MNIKCTDARLIKKLLEAPNSFVCREKSKMITFINVYGNFNIFQLQNVEMCLLQELSENKMEMLSGKVTYILLVVLLDLQFFKTKGLKGV